MASDGEKKRSVGRLSTDRNRRFCRALYETSAGRLRYTTIAALAGRLGLEEDEVIVLAADCAAAGYVKLDVKGPPYARSPGSAMLTDKGWRAMATRSPRRPPQRKS